MRRTGRGACPLDCRPVLRDAAESKDRTCHTLLMVTGITRSSSRSNLRDVLLLGHLTWTSSCRTLTDVLRPRPPGKGTSILYPSSIGKPSIFHINYRDHRLSARRHPQLFETFQPSRFLPIICVGSPPAAAGALCQSAIARIPGHRDCDLEAGRFLVAASTKTTSDNDRLSRGVIRLRISRGGGVGCSLDLDPDALLPAVCQESTNLGGSAFVRVLHHRTIPHQLDSSKRARRAVPGT